MTDKTEIVECETSLPVVENKSIAPIDISRLLSKVIDKGHDAIKMLDGLLELQEKQQKRIASAEFNKAKAVCQSELPSVTKTRKVWNKGRTAVTYRYASLDDARRDTLPVISKHGFSDSWKTENQERGILITYIVRHDLGHEESTSMFCPMEQSQYMNAIQRSGSTITYGKRYTFCDFWGVILDEDDDGRGNQAPTKKPAPKQEPEQIDPVKRSKWAIAFIDKSVVNCKTPEDWANAEKELRAQSWHTSEDLDYIHKLENNQPEEEDDFLSLI